MASLRSHNITYSGRFDGNTSWATSDTVSVTIADMAGKSYDEVIRYLDEKIDLIKEDIAEAILLGDKHEPRSVYELSAEEYLSLPASTRL
jgi:predicted RNase H-like HicB family nuclease